MDCLQFGKAGTKEGLALKSFFLFQRDCHGLSRGKQVLFWTWNVFWVLLSGLGLGVLSLLFAYGNYADGLFATYFQNLWIAGLNVLPVVVLGLFLWLLVGRAWVSFLLNSLITLGFSVANYFLLLFRDDPLMFEDLRYLREAVGITKTAGYDISPDGRIWFGAICVAAGWAMLFFLVRGRSAAKVRLPMAVAAAAATMPFWHYYSDWSVYNTYTANYNYINRWSSTQLYISKGFVYPFLHSITAGQIEEPEGYDEEAVEQLLSSYSDGEIDTPVDLITVQLEAFADLSEMGIEGVDFSLYDDYHAMEAEGVAGTLITNIFAGGTVDTERCFLTGLCTLPTFRSATNSYAWYFRTQGYTVEGSHPSYDWFYNRQNVNQYLGISNYYFYENHYADLSQAIAGDAILLPEILSLYEENRTDAPYFSFNVTYQGHGPYDTEEVWRGSHYTDGRYSEQTTNIIDNYLGSVEDTICQLRAFLDELAQEERPVVVVIYGDHKPWLGDGNSAYEELGVNLDVSTEEGFRNYYATDYLIWANDAAKAALDRDFTGTGPELSSCFLMNEVFAQCGYTGNAYLQATDEIRSVLPVITSVGKYVDASGTICTELTDAQQEALNTFRCLEYYWATEFQYEEYEQ